MTILSLGKMSRQGKRLFLGYQNKAFVSSGASGKYNCSYCQIYEVLSEGPATYESHDCNGQSDDAIFRCISNVL